MKSLLACLLVGSAALAADTTSRLLVDPVAQLRVGFDTNPLATGAAATDILGSTDTLTEAASVGFGLASRARPGGASAKLAYFGETVRFERLAEENYTSHRVSGTAQGTVAGWKCSGEASALFIDGSRDTLLSIAAANANGTSLWRERREQAQYRAKLLAQRDADAVRIRFSGSLLDYDYRTRYRSGHASFTDRGDLLGGLDLGWKQSARSLWLAGARVGAQQQDTVPLPGGSFEYSNHYTRLLAGWEGRFGTDTTFALVAGPDFRRYDGAVDPRVFHGRNRTLGWFEAAFATKLSPQLTLSARSTRWTWLSSTGKSAYVDLSTEVSVAWAVTKTTTLRASAKAHQCSYFPVIRNDWEYLGGIGITCKISPRWQVSADLLDHRGWNELTNVSDRKFARSIFALGASVKL